MRNAFIYFLIITALLFLGLSYINHNFLYSFLLLIPIYYLGIEDLIQTKQTIRSNFPVLGRLRYFMEDLRPKIYQYFVESNTDGTPFNRLDRSLVYSRAKKETETVPFGTQLNVYQAGYEWLNHSIKALPFDKVNRNPKIMIGSSQCTQPYAASIFNISAMSYGSLSKNAISALNQGAALGEFYHNTGEGGLSPYHLEGGDVVWNIGTGYFSCRTPEGEFDPVSFKERASLEAVKMIEIKFSQGAKPGHGGILPKEKVNDEIANIRLIPKGQDVISPPFHSAFKSPKEFVHFVKELRELSNGKPIGFKICIGNKSEFLSICKAMVNENIYVDFITVDGGEGGTGAAPLEFTNSVGMPLRDAVAFVYDALVGFGIKNQIKIICSGKITSGFDIFKIMSLGGDLCNSARGMMFALGCIQALECNTNTCPTGIATQNPGLVKGLVVDDKKTRVANYHLKTVHSFSELMAAAGYSKPTEIDRCAVYRRVDATKIETYFETYPEIPVGCLLEEKSVPTKFLSDWEKANINTY